MNSYIISKKFLQSLRATAGFTIIELLLYMTFLSMFLVIMTSLLAAILQVKAESEATSAVEQDGRYVLSRLNYDINQASAVTTPAALGGSGSSLALTIGGVTNTYAVSSTVLQVTNGLGTVNLTSSETRITSINFTRIGASGGKDTVKVQFTIASVTQRQTGAETRTFQTTIGLR